MRVLEASDEIVFVASMDLPNIKTAKLGLQTLRVLGIPDGRVRLVLNRANTIMPMDLEQVQEVVGARAEATIPSDLAIVHSVNKGAPVVLSSPKSGAAKSLKRLGELLFAASPTGAASPAGAASKER